jgi:hypothetical protein
MTFSSFLLPRSARKRSLHALARKPRANPGPLRIPYRARDSKTLEAGHFHGGIVAAIVNVTLGIGATITAPLVLTRCMFHTGRPFWDGNASLTLLPALSGSFRGLKGFLRF